MAVILIVEINIFVVTTCTILHANWSKIYIAAKETFIQTLHPDISATIDLTIDEPVNECVMLVDVADSGNEDILMAALTVVKKGKEAINVHLDVTDLDDESKSNSGSGVVENEDKDSDPPFIM